MKRFFIPLFSLCLLNASAQTASLDLQFGTAGIALHHTTTTSELNNVAVDGQGNIFTAGYVFDAPGSSVYRLMVSKTLANGQLDQSFATNGKAEITVGASEFPLDIVIAPNGKILVGGSAYSGHTPNGPGDNRGFVVRLNSNGSLDQSFAQSGIFYLQSPNTHFANILLRTNGAILLCGNAVDQAFLLQILDNGTPDTQFGNAGYLFLARPGFKFVLWNAIQNEDGSIVAVGNEATDTYDTKLAYCKINAQGTYDLTFGNNGSMTTDSYSGQPYVIETLTQIRKGQDGKYYMGGHNTSNVILRVNGNGTPDASYGSNGRVSHTYPYKDFVLQQNGKLIMIGAKEFTDYNYGWVITRLNADGAIDAGFANGQSFNLDISAKNDYPQALQIANGQNLFVVGSSYYNNVANATICKLKIGNTLSVQEMNSAQNISLYPNPVQETVTINAEDIIAGFDIVDISGRLVNQNNNLYARTATIDCNFPAGSYVINLYFKSGAKHTQALVKR
ncbi:hypothetical protein DBR32_10590 [Taibaiella sp. KBW10]|uniref:T9SS type A sorting domain-containing protein n=1 Tax=Taibaiella sp. KBW10 TaxID=2153357 RepID=UPI000F59A2E8|nr:T9SS type A sorting domain-containing protein [Taibaiella sp. KBW10]RQO31142.1 hypothetical protein DBR32_10590 [Taibaiella sp. KBW10]